MRLREPALCQYRSALTSTAGEGRPAALHILRLLAAYMHRHRRPGAHMGSGPTNPYEYIVASVT